MYLLSEIQSHMAVLYYSLTTLLRICLTLVRHKNYLHCQLGLQCTLFKHLPFPILVPLGSCEIILGPVQQPVCYVG